MGCIQLISQRYYGIGRCLDNDLEQCCPTFLYIGAHLTDGSGDAGACGDCNSSSSSNNNNNNNNNNKVILIQMTTDFIFYDSIS
jgi:hypothetical protein